MAILIPALEAALHPVFIERGFAQRPLNRPSASTEARAVFVPDQRVEVLWRRGLTDEWVRGTMLKGGRVQLDEHQSHVPDPPFILEPEEIADIRLAL